MEILVRLKKPGDPRHMACTSVGHFIRRMMIMQVSSRVGREWTCRFMISTPRRSSKSMQNSSKAQQRRGGGGLDPLQWTKVPCWLLLSLVLLILVLCPSACHGKYEQGYSEYNKDDNEDPSKRHVASLFQPPPQIRVLGPSEFPKPTDKLLLQNSSKAVQDMEPVVRVKPAYGHHRSNQDAILAYAEGYKLPWYQMFMETLTSTGYRGDVVLAIAEERIVSPHVVDYLKTFTVNDPNKPNLVLYQENLDCDNKSPSNTEYYGTNHRQLTKQGDTNPFQMCRLTNFYGWKKKQHDMDTDLQNNEDIVEPAADPRRGRVVATLRYEWYWIWSLQYEPDRWLMLLDARDSFFQTDPFVNLPRSKDVNSNNSQEKTSGLLYLFGENAQATRLGISKQNQQWIRRAYGDTTIEVLKGKPTICSGSTMGEQIAIESYLRAMVNEHDECSIKMMGADQGFHNYLYYSQKLVQATAIERIVVWEQGRGHINNLGALRTKPLREWGHLYDPDTHQVFQWPVDEQGDRVLSPVVHQWDRDKDLHGWMVRTKHKQWEQEWMQQQQQQQ